MATAVASTVMAAALVGNVTMLLDISRIQATNSTLLEQYVPVIAANASSIASLDNRLIVVETSQELLRNAVAKEEPEPSPQEAAMVEYLVSSINF